MALIETQPRRRKRLSFILPLLLIIAVAGGLGMLLFTFFKPSDVTPKEVVNTYSYKEFTAKPEEQ
ncbi:MAG: hypothetical protein CMH32_02160 [Micavibrio sp.]|jgi:flagellar basal body-associated protein FliL|nr:hypothetical protein [Micavibrio sp.]HCK32721.1 hypothetical protein [Rhodospirillaceae bacterium]|tara:strand:- start:416 stop:610 length:195 start_codon:yes stop_codon:yes gene_type:complete